MKKSTQLSVYLFSEKPQGVFMGTRGQTLAQSTGAAAPVRPRKCGHSCIFAALLEPRARRFLPRTVPSVPYQLQVPVSNFDPLDLTNQLSKVYA